MAEWEEVTTSVEASGERQSAAATDRRAAAHESSRDALEQDVRTSSIVVLSFNAISKAASAVAVLLLIRHLPVQEYATYTVVLTLALFAAQIVSTGINRLYILDSAVSAAGVRGSLLGMQCVVAIALIAVFHGVLAVESSLVPVAALYAIGVIGAEYVKTERQREHRFVQYGLMELGRSLLKFAGVLLLVTVGAAWLNAGTALGAQAVALCVLAVPLIVRLGLFRGTGDLPRSVAVGRRLLSGDRIYLFLYLLVLALFVKLDVFLLTLLAGTLDVATYGSAFQYYGLLVLALASVHAVYLPTVARVEPGPELNDLYRKHRGLVALFLPGVLAVMAVARWAIPWVDGGRYPDAVHVFWVLAVSAMISFAFSPHVHVLMKFDRYRALAGLVIAGTVLNTLLNLVAIPRFGAVGAAVGTLVSFGAVNVSFFFLSRSTVAKVRERA